MSKPFCICKHAMWVLQPSMLAWVTMCLQAAQGSLPRGCPPCTSAQNACLGSQEPGGSKHRCNNDAFCTHAMLGHVAHHNGLDRETHLQAAQVSVLVPSDDVSHVPGPSIFACARDKKILYEHLCICKHAVLEHATRVAWTYVAAPLAVQGRSSVQALGRCHTGCVSSTLTSCGILQGSPAGEGPAPLLAAPVWGRQAGRECSQCLAHA